MMMPSMKKQAIWISPIVWLFLSRQAAATTAPPGPTLPGTTANCDVWYVVQSGDTCDSVEKRYSISHSQFLKWNPSVSGDCKTNFWAQEAYCVKTGSAAPAPPTKTTSMTASRAPSRVTSPPGPTLSGTASNCNSWHLVVSGDSCDNIERTYGISHAQFLLWNKAVSSDCMTNFWANEAYCVGVGAAVTTTASMTTASSTQKPPTRVTSPPGPTFTDAAPNCNNWYLIKSGDTCDSVAKLYGISKAQFLAWNPSVSSDCKTNFWLNEAYCVGVGPAISTTNATYSIRHSLTTWNITTSPTATAWPPSHTQKGQPAYCNNWHLVASADTCESISSMYGTWMSYSDFLDWNPALGEDCSGLFVDWYVCVGVQPQTQRSLYWPTGNATLPPYVTPKSTILPTINSTFIPSPTQGTIPTGCQAFYQAQSGDTCEKVVAKYPFITKAQFFSWNPFLKNNCGGLLIGYYYCVALFSPNSLPPPPTVSGDTRPYPLPLDTIDTCQAYYMATGSDDCSLIALMFGTFSRSDFIKWNPSVGSSCNSVRQNVYYCVSVPNTPTTRTAAAPSTTTKAAERPTQPGIAGKCSKYWLVSSSDTCDKIVDVNGIGKSDFTSWNPAVGSNCTLTANYYVCVGVSSKRG